MTARDVLHGNRKGLLIGLAILGGIVLGYGWFWLGRLCVDLIAQVFA